jgi:hypothetical protein
MEGRLIYRVAKEGGFWQPILLDYRVKRLRSKKRMERRIMWVFCEFMRNYVKA